MSIKDIFGVPGAARHKKDEGEHWISMSDLMAGLMMVFLFISVAYMRYAEHEKDKVKELAVAYQKSQVALYEALNAEFKDELPVWDAEIDKTTLEFKFKSPEVLFSVGDIALKSNFKAILDDFFPRYLKILKRFEEDISEIRIEGHTSSAWNGSTNPDDSYFKNMQLSQGRTRSVLQYIYLLPALEKEKNWVKKTFAAVGFSSAHPIVNDKGKEDEERSRRVSFRVLTNAELQIQRIIQGK